MGDVYQVFMHREGEVLVEGELTEEELQEAIRQHAPEGAAERPGMTIARTVLNGGAMAIDGWALAVVKL